MSWIEIVTEVPREYAETLSDALLEAGALSVSIEDADLGTEAEQPLFGEPGMQPEAAAWARSRVIALTATDANQRAMLTNAAHAAGLKHGASLNCSLRPVEEQDWVRLTQQQFEPIHIGQRIWIVPSWHAAPEPDALVLHLDPGLAFGTGSHATTRLCAEWLETQKLQQRSVLDYGCGSGILALVAKKLGSAQTVGVDIDPQAVSTAQHNALVNQADITFLLPDQLATQSAQFDIVVANILTNPLKILAPLLLAQLNSSGTLLLSGVLARQAQEVIDAYAPTIALTVWAEHDGWVALSGQLPARLS